MAVGFVHVGVYRPPPTAKAPPGVQEYYWTVHAPDGHIGVQHGLLFATAIGQHSYLNVLCLEPKEQDAIHEGWKEEWLQGHFLLYRYRFADGRLVVRPINSETQQSLVNRGRIKGNGDTGVFTDTPQKIAQLIATETDRLFETPEVRLDRVR